MRIQRFTHPDLGMPKVDTSTSHKVEKLTSRQEAGRVADTDCRAAGPLEDLLSSERGNYKTVKARLWPFMRQKSLEYFKLIPIQRPGGVRVGAEHVNPHSGLDAS